VGRLLDLASENGYTLGNLAAACVVSPELLVRIDQTAQPLPIKLAKNIAHVLRVGLSDVLSAAVFITELEALELYTAIPPKLGEPIPPFKVIPLQEPEIIPNPVPEPVTTEALFVFASFVEVPSIEPVVLRYTVSSAGVFALVASKTAAGVLAGVDGGAVAFDGKLYVYGCDESAIPQIAKLDPDTLATVLQGAVPDPMTGFVNFGKLIGDPTQAQTWFLTGSANPRVASVDAVLTFDTPVDLSGFDFPTYLGFYPFGFCFPGDGFLYAITVHIGMDASPSTVVFQIDPTVGGSSVTLATTDKQVFGDSSSLMWVASASKFYSGASGGIVSWAPDTLDPTFIGPSLGDNPLLFGGVYDVDSDSFWFYGFTDGSFHAMRVPRATGIPDFVSTETFAPTAQRTEPALMTEAGLAIFCGTDDITGDKTLYAYSMSTPALVSTLALPLTDDAAFSVLGVQL
jgi:hypothetical protein